MCSSDLARRCRQAWRDALARADSAYGRRGTCGGDRRTCGAEEPAAAAAAAAAMEAGRAYVGLMVRENRELSRVGRGRVTYLEAAERAAAGRVDAAGLRVMRAQLAHVRRRGRPRQQLVGVMAALAAALLAYGDGVGPGESAARAAAQREAAGLAAELREMGADDGAALRVVAEVVRRGLG